MIRIVYAVLISVFVSLAADIIAWKISSGSWRRWLIVLILGMTMTAITLTSLQQKSFLFEAESNVLKTVSKLRSMESDSVRRRRLSAFLDSNFTLVNTSRDPELYPQSDGYDVITDRNKLSQLVTFLCERKDLLDLVVVDIKFIDATAYDSALRASLNCLKEKLVLSYTEKRDLSNSYFYQNVDRSSLGDVSLQPDEPSYFTDRLIDDERIPSLSYRMYMKMNGVSLPRTEDWLLKETSHGKTYYAFHEFIPELHFIDEKELYSNSDSRSDPESIGENGDSLQKTGPSMIENLGYWISVPGRIMLNDRLIMNKRHGHNIVFIGSFLSKFEDTHPTAYGDLHGTTLLLNEYYEFTKGRHHFTLLQLIGYVLTLLAGFAGIFWFMIHRSEKRSQRATAATRPEKERKSSIFLYTKTFFVFIIDELHYFFLLAFAIIVAFLWGKILNLLAIAYYLVIFEAFLQLFFRHYLMPPARAATKGS